MRLVTLQGPDVLEAAVVVDGAAVPVHELLEPRALPRGVDPGDAVNPLALLGDWPGTRDALEAAAADADPADGIGLEEADLAAPVPRPPSFRDFYAFEEHVSRSWKRRGEPVPEAWYDVPVFYFSNPASIVGPDAQVPRPSSTEQLDFELEVGWVIGQRARDLDPDEALDAVAGLTVLNDFSGRDVQAREMSVGLGPSKGKDFATGMGPALVTLDELEDARGDKAFDLEMRARVNGEQVSEGNLDDLHHSIGEMTAHASRDTVLEPGDVMGTGTVGTGCVLDLGTEDWLEPGDKIELEVERLGQLTHTITEP